MLVSLQCNLDTYQCNEMCIVCFEIGRTINDDNGISKVELYFSPDSSMWYLIIYLDYCNINNNITFNWIFPLKCWRNGWVNVLGRKHDNTKIQNQVLKMPNIEKRIQSPKLLPVSEYSKIETGMGEWPMFRYNPQHTGAYPFTFSPHIDLVWSFETVDNDFIMLSGSANEDLIFVGNGLEKILALHTSTGNIMWEQCLTSNVWTTILVDTLVFVGTSFEPSLTLPTFFCLDARTGEILWSDFFWTVEFAPVSIDSYVVVTTFTKIRGYLINGILKWETLLSDSAAVQFNPPTVFSHEVYIGGTNKIIKALDLFTGEIIWQKTMSEKITSPITAGDSLLFFFSQYGLNCFDNDGTMNWHADIYPHSIRSGIGLVDSSIFCAYLGQNGTSQYTIAECYTKMGLRKWHVEFNPSDGAGSTGGITTKNNLFWFSNTKNIFTVDCRNGELIHKEDSFSSIDGYNCWAWPLIVNDKFMVAKGNCLLCFQNQEYELPEANVLCWPNPFTNLLRISVQLEHYGTIRLYCIDITGRIINTITDCEYQSGVHYFNWDGTDKFGEGIPAGIYFIYYSISHYKPGVKKLVFVGKRRNNEEFYNNHD
jgi:outer membrane protein assembly factor BamB